MTNAKTITGLVLNTKRAGTSNYGNPSFDVTIRLTEIEGTPVTASHDELRTVTVRTQSNSGIAYGIQNPEYRDQAHVFTLTPAGRIRNVSAVSA
jgi:hypothetical protein